MALRYQKRIGGNKGLGLNVSNSGISSSYRNRYGTFGARGFSVRTGIPGVAFRQNFRGRNKGSAALMVLLVICAGFILYYAVVAAYNLLLLLVWAIGETGKFSLRKYKSWQHTRLQTKNTIQEDQKNKR